MMSADAKAASCRTVPVGDARLSAQPAQRFLQLLDLGHVVASSRSRSSGSNLRAAIRRARSG